MNWGDGTQTESLGADANKATHTYTQPGNFTATIVATDEDGSYQLSGVVQVRPDATSLSAGGPYQVAEGQSLALTATAFGSPISWAWDVGSGDFTDATGKSATIPWCSSSKWDSTAAKRDSCE